MVEVSDLVEDYHEVVKSGELEGPRKMKGLNIWMKILLLVVVFTLTFWTAAWLY